MTMINALRKKPASGDRFRVIGDSIGRVPNGFAVLLRASFVPLRVRRKASPPLRPSCDRQQQPLVRLIL